MKKNIFIICMIIFTIFTTVENSYPLTYSDLGTEITISDGIADSVIGIGIAGEDNETEYGTVQAQKWDLESIFWNSNTSSLYVISGFNYWAGEYSGSTNVSIGDLFIGDDYVLDLERSNGNLKYNSTGTDGNFNIIKDYEHTSDVTYRLESNPYQYLDAGTDVGAGTYEVDYFSDFDLFGTTGWNGVGDHYVLGLHGLDGLNDIINDGGLVHLTMECGNDTIHGVAENTPVPEPASCLLLMLGLVGFIMILKFLHLGRTPQLEVVDEFPSI